MFETFAVGEVSKSHMSADASLRDIRFYRGAKKREIDLVIPLVTPKQLVDAVFIWM